MDKKENLPDQKKGEGKQAVKARDGLRRRRRNEGIFTAKWELRHATGSMAVELERDCKKKKAGTVLLLTNEKKREKKAWARNSVRTSRGGQVKVRDRGL